jgi:hypothetical protein
MDMWDYFTSKVTPSEPKQLAPPAQTVGEVYQGRDGELLEVVGWEGLGPRDEVFFKKADGTRCWGTITRKLLSPEHGYTRVK